MCAAAMACVNEQLCVCLHKRDVHGHPAPVGQYKRVVPFHFLDDAEDVVPSSCVQPCDVVAEFVEDFIHFESSEDRFDQYRRLDDAPRDTEYILCDIEDIVPQPCLFVTFQLG